MLRFRNLDFSRGGNIRWSSQVLGDKPMARSQLIRAARIGAITLSALLACLAVDVVWGRGSVDRGGVRSAESHSMKPDCSNVRSRIDRLPLLFAELTTAFDSCESRNEADRRMADLLSDSRDGRLDRFTLFEAGLMVSGTIEKSDLVKYTTLHDGVVRSIAKNIARAADTRGADAIGPAEQAELIHRYLHKHLFTGKYRVEVSEPGHVFESGDFNCVSATLLFCDICRRLGIECHIVHWPEHVACLVVTETGAVAIETTCPIWFTKCRDDVGKMAETRPRRSFAAHAGTARRLTHAQLLGLIDYNRGVQHLNAKDHIAAMQASYRALQFHPENKAAWNNFLAAVNNRAVVLCRTAAFEEALELLQRGQQVAPEYAGFRANRAYVWRCQKAAGA